MRAQPSCAESGTLPSIPTWPPGARSSMSATLASRVRPPVSAAPLRKLGRPTAHPHALDADAILAAQASLCGGPGDEVIVATTNVGHLARFPGIDARPWDTIT